MATLPKVLIKQADSKSAGGVALRVRTQALEKEHPLVRRKYARAPDPRPRMVEAYLFFHGRLREFFLGSSSDSDSVLYGDVPLAARLEECFQALKSALLIVA